MSHRSCSPFLFVLSIVCLARLLTADCPPDPPGITGCVCSDLSNGIIFSCNSVSVRSVVTGIQAAGIAGEVDRLNFLLAPEVTLPTNTFLGFDSLRELRLQGGVLSSIEPGAFNSLPQLINLDLRFNNLEWLSEEMFTGIGTQLENLHVDSNQVRHLRSNLQPFFSSISDSISLSGNILMCDCHLQWLVGFLVSSRATVTGAVCNGSSVPIADPSVSFGDCQDVCSLQFHNCHENATCQPNVTGFCVCDPGFVGDGSLSCDHICDTSYSRCHVNSTCQLDASTEVVCTCLPGLKGDGHTCTMVGECLLECPGDNRHCVSGVVEYCTCDTGSVLLGDLCVQNYTGVECPEDSLANYQWPATVVGTTAYTPCSNRDGVFVGNVSRDCAAGGVWGELIAPAPTCVSPAVQDLLRRASTLQTDRSADPELVMFTADLLDAATSITFAGDIPQIVDLLHFSVDVLANSTNRSVPPSHETVVEIGSELLEGKNNQLWEQLTDSQVSNNVVDLFAAMDELGEALFTLFNTSHIITITSKNIALVVLRPNCTRSGEVEEVDITISSQLLASPVGGSESKLQLPPTLFSDALGGGVYDCSDVGIVAVVYNGAGPLYSLNGSSLLPDCEVAMPPLAHGRCEWYAVQTQCPMVRVNSVIISAVVVSTNQMVNTSMLSEPIIITLQHEDVNLVRPMCSFLNEQEVQLQGDGTWLTEGCVAVEAASTPNMTVCQCFHLTSFALLMSPTGPPPQNLPLQIVSKVGLCISIICLIISIVLLFGLKLDGKLHHIHRQLALALCLSQLVFLVGVDRTLVPSPDGLCTTIAALLHYLLLCTFAWQLIEGIHLYLFIVKVFFNERIVWAYYPLGWGVPLVVVAITLGIRFCDYGSQNYCWITTGNGTNWAFHGPVIAVLLVNIVIMMIVTTVILRAAKRREKDTCLLCTLFHASLVLLPILGITWLLGFLVVGDSLYSLVVEWLFCIFTTLQGVMIFVMHCILNRDVRAAFLKRVGCREAAKQQSTVMTMSRRLSHSSSTSSFGSIFKKPFLRNRTLKCDDITSLTSYPADHRSGVFSGSFAVARPNRDYVLENLNRDLHDIAEEGESAASTPELRTSVPAHGGAQSSSTPELRTSSVVSMSAPSGARLSPSSTPKLP